MVSPSLPIAKESSLQAVLKIGTSAGTMTKKEIEDNYAISRRIEAEERALETATMVLTSTQQEIDEQWGLYDGCAPFCLTSTIHHRTEMGLGLWSA